MGPWKKGDKRHLEFPSDVPKPKKAAKKSTIEKGTTLLEQAAAQEHLIHITIDLIDLCVSVIGEYIQQVRL